MTITGSPDKASSHLYFESSESGSDVEIKIYFNPRYDVGADGIFIGKNLDGSGATDGVKEFRVMFNNFQINTVTIPSTPSTPSTSLLTYYDFYYLGSSPYNGVSMSTKSEDYYSIHDGRTDPILILTLTGTKTGTGDISLKPGELNTSVKARSLVRGSSGFAYSVVNGYTTYTHGTHIMKSNEAGDNVVSTGRTFVISVSKT
jgi:hypothetical protein